VGTQNNQSFADCHGERGRTPESNHPCANGTATSAPGNLQQELSLELPGTVAISANKRGVLRLRAQDDISQKGLGD